MIVVLVEECLDEPSCSAPSITLLNYTILGMFRKAMQQSLQMQYEVYTPISDAFMDSQRPVYLSMLDLMNICVEYDTLYDFSR